MSIDAQNFLTRSINPLSQLSSAVSSSAINFTTPSIASSNLSSLPSATLHSNGLINMMVNMMSLMMTMLQSILRLSQNATPVINQPAINYHDNASIQVRQQTLLGGQDSQLDNLLRQINQTNPESPEAEQLQSAITSRWNAVGGEQSSLNEYFALHGLKQLNDIIDTLGGAILPNLEPESVEAQQVNARLAALQARRTATIHQLQQFPGAPILNNPVVPVLYSSNGLGNLLSGNLA
jgi:hypothetical protein